MKSSLLIAFLSLLVPVVVSAQSSGLDKAVNTMAQKLAAQLNNRGVKRAGVADFTFRGYNNTRIGKYVADRLSVKLQENGARCAMTDRSVVRSGLSGQSNPRSAKPPVVTDQTTDNVQVITNKNATADQKTGAALDESLALIKRLGDRPSNPLKNTDVIIYGDIEELGDQLIMTARVVRNNKKADNIAAAESYVAITPDVTALMDGPAPPSQPVTPLSVPGENPPVYSTSPQAGMDVTPFKYQNLTFEVLSCIQSGRTMEIKLRIYAAQEDTELWVNFHETKFFDSATGAQFPPSEIHLADITGTRNYVKKEIVADHSIEALFRFNDVNQEVQSISSLQVNTYHFQAKLKNIPVTR